MLALFSNTGKFNISDGRLKAPGSRTGESALFMFGDERSKTDAGATPLLTTKAAPGERPKDGLARSKTGDHGPSLKGSQAGPKAPHIGEHTLPLGPPNLTWGNILDGGNNNWGGAKRSPAGLHPRPSGA